MQPRRHVIIVIVSRPHCSQSETIRQSTYVLFSFCSSIRLNSEINVYHRLFIWSHQNKLITTSEWKELAARHRKANRIYAMCTEWTRFSLPSSPKEENYVRCKMKNTFELIIINSSDWKLKQFHSQCDCCCTRRTTKSFVGQNIKCTGPNTGKQK